MWAGGQTSPLNPSYQAHKGKALGWRGQQERKQLTPMTLQSRATYWSWTVQGSAHSSQRGKQTAMPSQGLCDSHLAYALTYLGYKMLVGTGAAEVFTLWDYTLWKAIWPSLFKLPYSLLQKTHSLLHSLVYFLIPWENTRVQPLWKASKITHSYTPFKKCILHMHLETAIKMVIGSPFTAAKNLKQCKSPPARERINTQWHTRQEK